MYRFLSTSIIILSSIVVLAVPLLSVYASNTPLVSCSGVDCTYDDLISTLGNVVTFLVQLATGIAVIVLAYAGFLYMSARGNTGQVERAHKLIGYAVVGFLIALSAWLIVKVILTTLGVNDYRIMRPFYGQ